MDEKLSEFGLYLVGWMNRDIASGDISDAEVLANVIEELDERFGA